MAKEIYGDGASYPDKVDTIRYASYLKISKYKYNAGLKAAYANGQRDVAASFGQSGLAQGAKKVVNEIGQTLINYYNLENQFKFFTDLIIEYGYLFIFIAGFTPVPYKIAAMGSGFINLPILIFIIVSFFSRGLRFFIVTYFSSRLGASAEKIISKYFFYISLLLFLIIIMILISEIIL